MKDVEFVANLLLLLEEGPKGYSVEELDKAFSDRDQSWEGPGNLRGAVPEGKSRNHETTEEPDGGVIKSSRLRNQADFYSLFGAVEALQAASQLPATNDAARRLVEFLAVVEDEDGRSKSPQAQKYYEAARSASNLAANRKQRIDTMKLVLLGLFKSAADT